MLPDVIRVIINRDLKKLMEEIQLFQKEDNIWKLEKGINNSAGNLCLHLVGNLNTYIGAVIGKTNYVRDREAEFSLKNIPQATLIESIAATISIVDKSLQSLNDLDMDKEYPIQVLEKKTTTEYFLVHLAAHLSYHLGQVNYCRRLLDV